MTEERFRDFETRLRKVEDFILSQLNMLLELSQSMKGRIEMLEEHDKEFMAMVHNTCDVKNKEISTAREEAIRISVDHTNKTHRQTWIVVAAMYGTFISAVLYFNHENTSRALDIQKNNTQIDAIIKTLDKIDSKTDKMIDHISDEKIGK